MTNQDFSVMKDNISALMKKNHVSQEDLAGVLNMSQSNVSKCLKQGDDSRRFTLEQACAIADHFNITLDELIGRKPKGHEYSSEEICKLFSYLVSNYVVKHFDYQVDESAYLPYGGEFNYNPTEKKVTYDAFYFPNYFTPPKYLLEADSPEIDERINDWEVDSLNGGNDMPTNIEINSFLHKYIEAFEKHDAGIYDKETFDILVNAYYQVLNK